MPRSDRSLIVAGIFGLATICFGAGLTIGGDWTSQPYERSQKPYASAERYGAQPLGTGFAAYPRPESNRCYQAKDHDSADLCAQWRAAIAAEKAADFAEWSVLLSVIGSVLSGIGIIALVVTIRQGREGLRKAQEANKLSAKTARRQLRPYLFYESASITEIEEGGARFGLVFRNFGQTPAYDISYSSVRKVVISPMTRAQTELAFDITRVLPSIGPGHNRHTFMTISRRTGSLVKSGSHVFLIKGRIDYALSAKGKKRDYDDICMVIDAKALKVGQARFVNEADYEDHPRHKPKRI